MHVAYCYIHKIHSRIKEINTKLLDKNLFILSSDDHTSDNLSEHFTPKHLMKFTSNLVLTTVTGNRVIPAIVLAHAPNATDSPIVLSSL